MVVYGVVNISANVNPDGSIVSLDSDSNGSCVTLVGDVTLGSGPNPCTSLGDILGWVSLAVLIFFMVYQSVTERRVKRVAQSFFMCNGLAGFPNLLELLNQGDIE